MFEFQQVFLTTLIATLTVLIIIFSIFVFRILKEFRQTLQKVNKILDDASVISGSVVRPIAGISDLVSGLKSGMKVFEVISHIAGKRRKQTAQDAETDEADE